MLVYWAERWSHTGIHRSPVCLTGAKPSHLILIKVNDSPAFFKQSAPLNCSCDVIKIHWKWYVSRQLFQMLFLFFIFLYLIYQSEHVKKKWTRRIWRRSQSSYAKRSISSFLLNLKSPSAQEDPLCEKFCKNSLIQNPFILHLTCFQS